MTTSWDLLTGAAKPAECLIVYDDNGAHPGMSAAEFAAQSGARLEIVPGGHLATIESADAVNALLLEHLAG